MRKENGSFDATLKSLFLKSPPTLLSRATQGVKIRQALNVEQKRVRPVKERAMDLLFELDDGSNLQGEVQSRNHPKMEWRMLDHRVEAGLAGSRKRLRQIVIYVGKRPLRMRDRIDEEDLSFRYHLVDIRDFHAEDLLGSSASASDIVLALLAGGVEDRRLLAERVARRANALPPAIRAEAIAAMMLSSPLRDSETIVSEAIMGLNLDWSDNKVLRQWREEGRQLWREEGRQEGREQGRQTALRDALQTVLTERFGRVPGWASARIRTARADQLGKWIAGAVTAESIQALLGPRA